MPKERISQFAKRIGSGNIIEAMRTAINLIWVSDQKELDDYLCGFHTDVHNDRQFPHVVTLSGIIWIIPNKLAARVVIIGYTRWSGNNFIDRVQTIGSAVTYVYDTYTQIPLWRRDSVAYLELIYSETPHSGRLPYGLSYYVMECHNNPLVYCGPWIHYLCALYYRFHLDYVELVSLLRAAGSNAYTPYFWAVIAERRMYDGFPISQRGILIGHYFLSDMFEIERAWKEDKNKVPGLHYQKNEDILPTVDKWKEHVTAMVHGFLISWGDDGITKNSSLRKNAYAKLFRAIFGDWKKCGRLGGNNILLTASAVGICPFCFVTEYHHPQSSKPLKELHELFDIGKTEAYCRQYLSSLAAYMTAQGIYSNLRIAEQTVCKAARQRLETKTPYRDLYIYYNNIYETAKNKMIVHFPPCEKKKPVSLHHGMLTHFPFRYKWMTPEAIAHSVRDQSEVPNCVNDYPTSPSPNKTKNLLWM